MDRAYVPKGMWVPPDLEAVTDQLAATYTRACDDLIRIIHRADVTDWRRAFSKQQLAQVRSVLAGLGDECKAWVAEHVPELYENGLAVADQYLMAPAHVPLYRAAREAGLDHFAAVARVNEQTGNAGPGGLSVAAHPGQVTPMDLRFTRLHAEAVRILSENIVAPLVNGDPKSDWYPTQIGANSYCAQRLGDMIARSKLLSQKHWGGDERKAWTRQLEYREVSLDTLQDAFARGDTQRQAESAFLAGLERKGIVGFTDRAGRDWDLRVYANMVVQTVAQETYRHGTENRLIEHGHDLVKITGHHAGECDACDRYAGHVLSLTGETPGYPRVDTAIDEGLFHPRCRHSEVPYIPEYAEAA